MVTPTPTLPDEVWHLLDNRTAWDSPEFREFCSHAIKFILQPSLHHCWCKHSNVMLHLLCLFEHKSRNQQIDDIIEKCRLELNKCHKCVLRYHRSKQDFAQQYRAFCTEESIEFVLSILKNQDIERVERRLKEVPHDEEEKLIPTFFEILHFPEYLDTKDINEEFTKRVSYIAEMEQDLQIEQKIPGIYQLLFHPHVAVRSWAFEASLTSRIGFIQSEDFGNLIPVLTKLMTILEFDNFGNDDDGGCITTSRKVFWAGFANLLVRFDRACLENGFIPTFPNFVNIMLNYIGESSSDIFWQIIKCFSVVLGMMGYQIWLSTPSFQPSGVLNTLKKQCTTFTQNVHGIFPVMHSVLLSMEPISDAEEFVKEASNLILFLLTDMTKDNHSQLTRLHAALFASKIVSSCYEFTPPKQPLGRARWGPALAGYLSAVPQEPFSQLTLSIKKNIQLLFVRVLDCDGQVIRNLFAGRDGETTLLLAKDWPRPFLSECFKQVNSHQNLQLVFVLDILQQFTKLTLIPSEVNEEYKINLPQYAMVNLLMSSFLARQRGRKDLIQDPKFVSILPLYLLSSDKNVRNEVATLLRESGHQSIDIVLQEYCTQHLTPFFEGLFVCLKELLVFRVVRCQASLERLFYHAQKLLPFAHQLVSQSKGPAAVQMKESLVVHKVLRYLWAICEILLEEQVNYVSGNVSFMEEALCQFMDCIASLFPLFAIQSYPFRLMAKIRSNNSKDESFEGESQGLSQSSSSVGQSPSQRAIASIVSNHQYWLPLFLTWTDSKKTSQKVYSRWLSALLVILKEMRANSIGLLEDDRDLIMDAVHHENDNVKNEVLGYMKQPTPVPKSTTTMESKPEPISLDDFMELAEEPVITNNNNNNNAPTKIIIDDNNNVDTYHTEKDSKNEKESDEDLSETLLEQLAEDDAMRTFREKVKALPQHKKTQLMSPPVVGGLKKKIIHPVQPKQTFKPGTLEDLFRHILDWDYHKLHEHLEHSRELRDITVQFESANEYRTIFEPLLIEEVRANLQQEKEANYNTNIPSVFAGVECINDFHIVELKLPDTPSKCKLKQDDIVVISKDKIDVSKVYLLGKVEGHLPGMEKKKDAKYIKIRCYLKNNKEAFSMLKKDSEWRVRKITNIISAIREFKALQSIHRMKVLPFILSPQACLASVKENPISDIYLACLKNRFNASQIAAVKAAVSRQGFVLIQGPPGTGKTKTICGLLSVYFNTAPVSIGPVKTGIPVVRKTPTMLPGSKQPATENKSSRNHVLVCAPSNAAVDEIVLRLVTTGLLDINGNSYKPNVVRIGDPESMNPLIQDYALDNILQKQVKSSQSSYANTELQVQQTRAKIEEHRKTIFQIKELTAGLKKDMQALRQANAADDEVRSKQLRLDTLERDLRNAHTKLSSLITEDRASPMKLDAAQKQMIKDILNNASIICCTLSGSGSEKLQVLESGFNTVIIDEAAQSVELSSLIPLQYGCSTCIMVGDPNQLPATVLSKVAAKYQYEQSLFQRLVLANSPVFMLKTQYRMHKEIRTFPSLHFYGDQLTDGENVLTYDQPYYKAPDRRFGPFMFFDVASSSEKTASSYKNTTEVQFIKLLIKSLLEQYPKYDFVNKIGVVTPYKQQYAELKDQLYRSAIKRDVLDSIEINTVDGFQGREKDIIILSCVRAHSEKSVGIGFLSDIRRMNVALTRSKFALLVVGHATSLQVNPHWKRFIENAQDRRCSIKVNDVEKFFSGGHWGSDNNNDTNQDKRRDDNRDGYKKDDKRKDYDRRDDRDYDRRDSDRRRDDRDYHDRDRPRSSSRDRSRSKSRDRRSNSPPHKRSRDY